MLMRTRSLLLLLPLAAPLACGATLPRGKIAAGGF